LEGKIEYGKKNSLLCSPLSSLNRQTFPFFAWWFPDVPVIEATGSSFEETPSSFLSPMNRYPAFLLLAVWQPPA